jgi:hypothetical protein
MTRIRAATALITAAAVLVPAGVAGADDPPPPRCTYKLPKTYRLKALVRHGIPMKVTCATSTKVSPLIMFKGGTRQENKWEDIHNHGIPGIDKSGIFNAPAGQRITARVRLWKPVVKFVKRYRKTRFRVLLGTQVPGKPYYQSIDNGKVVTVRR